MPSGLVRVLFRSRITSDGFALRIAASAASADRANVTATPSWCAAVLIFDENIKSSSTATIMDPHDTGDAGGRSLLQERLCRRLRDDERGGADRPRRRGREPARFREAREADHS